MNEDLNVDSSADAEHEFPANAWPIFITLLFGTFITIEAAAFQSPALAPLSRHFGVPVSSVALVMLSYYLGAAIFSPVMGRLSDQYGRKRIIMYGLALFGLAEVGAALSTNFTLFLLARFAQGLGVACILPVVLATISYLFPADKRGFPLGVMAFAMAFGATSGGLLGGLLIDRFGWPSIYWVSAGLALLGLLLVAKQVPEMPVSDQKRGYDIVGSLLLLVSIGCLLSLPILIGNFGFGSSFMLTALAVGFAAAVCLWRHADRQPWPVVEVDLLRQRSFLFPALIAFLHAVCSGGAIFCLAFVIADRPGGSASQVGFVNMFVYGGSALMAPLAGVLVDRVGARRVMLTALVTMFITMILYAQINATTPLGAIVVIALLMGLVGGAKTPSVMQCALSVVPRERMGSGSGLISMLRDLGSPAGSSSSLAIYGATVGSSLYMAVREQAQKAGLSDSLNDALERAVSSRGEDLAPELATALSDRGMQFTDIFDSSMVQAIAHAMPQVGSALAAITAVALLLAWALPSNIQQVKHQQKSGGSYQPVETKS